MVANRATAAGLNPFNIGGSNVNISSGVFMSDANKKTTVVTGRGSNITEGLPQSPLVSPTTPLPLHQSNVDVAATFGVLFSMVVDLEVLITDIDA
ncbi:hypothetical protein Tco_0372078, partial [Tanacetum coccineum]